MKVRVGVLAVLVAIAVPAPAAEPVLLLHGLGAGAGTWERYGRHLVASGWTEGCLISFARDSVEPVSKPTSAPAPGNLTGSAAWDPQAQCSTGWLRGKGRPFFRVVFEAPDSQTFGTQGRQVAAAVALVRSWTGSGRVALVGHSMGGLAARAYLQSQAYAGDVSLLATVDTPHMGSLLAYVRPDDPGVAAILELFRDAPLFQALLRSWVRSKLLAPAVDYLRPDSAEMIALNAPTEPYGALPNATRYLNVIGTVDLKNDSAAASVSRLLTLSLIHISEPTRPY